MALDDVVLRLVLGPLREPLGLDNMVLDTQVLFVLAGMQWTEDPSARRTLVQQTSALPASQVAHAHCR